MPDFEDIEISLKCHFCPNCGCSFECADEDGSCYCPGTQYSYDPPWCDECTEARQTEEEQAREEEEREDEEQEEDDDEDKCD